MSSKYFEIPIIYRGILDNVSAQWGYLLIVSGYAMNNDRNY